jgi:hypothetical protein
VLDVRAVCQRKIRRAECGIEARSVCMYVCMHACMYVSMYVQGNIYICIYIYIYIYGSAV